jgi:alkanesulfonate monooxygenase SsuD/methylene tetrahydromethanopterin reductase-like flavin-dependent oxidoreductase (luciferase family)
MRYGIDIPNFGPFGSARVVADLAASAEQAGWDGVFIWDHVVRREGDFPVVDPWVALTAAAAVTSRVRLGPMITPLPRRRPWNVAKAAVSIDEFSGGRFVLGVGTGTLRGPEFPAFGEETDARRRGDMLDEGLAVVRAVWSGAPVRCAGAHYRIDGVRFLPGPVSPAGIPIWSATEVARGRSVRRAASLDGVALSGIEPADLPDLLAEIGRHRTGTDAFEVAAISRRDDAAEWQQAGATWWLRELAWEWPLPRVTELVAAGPPGR